MDIDNDVALPWTAEPFAMCMTVATISSNPWCCRRALAILEVVAHEGLLRLEAALCHPIGLQRVRVLQFLQPVSLPIFHSSAEIRQAARPQRMNPIGE